MDKLKLFSKREFPESNEHAFTQETYFLMLCMRHVSIKVLQKQQQRSKLPPNISQNSLLRFQYAGNIFQTTSVFLGEKD